MRSVRTKLAPGRRPTVATLVAIVALALAAAASAAAKGAIGFYGNPGTGTPPAKLRGAKMKKFSADTHAPGTSVKSVSGPTGKLSFSVPATVESVGNGWATWSNGYKGSVYFFQKCCTARITLPPKTGAFYLYVEPNAFVVHHITVKAGSASSGKTTVFGNAGAKYFGFYAKKKGGSIKSVVVTCDDTHGFGIGEFGISKAKPKHKKK